MNLVHCYQGTDDFHSLLPVRNLAELLQTHSENSRPFLSYYRLGQPVLTLTYQRFHQRSTALAAILQAELNVKKGDRVVVMLSNGPEILLAYGALFHLGVVAVPLNPEERVEFLQSIVERTGAKAILREKDTSDAFGVPVLLMADLLERNAPIAPPLASIAPEEPAVIFFTSGTTGTSKGAVLSHANLLINSVATQVLHKMDANSTHMAVLPLFHVNAFSFSFLTTLLAGSHLILNKNFFQPSFWKVLQTERVQVVSLVPSILELLNRDKTFEFRRSDYPHLKYFVTAAAPLSSALLKSFVARFGIRIVQAYGLSETVNFSLTVPPELSDDEYHEMMLESDIPPAGTPVFGNEIAIADPQTGQLLAPEQKGEIVIRGWNVMDGYFSDRQATDQAFESGWFHTGDLGLFRESRSGQKYFFITGRVKEIAKRNGELIALAEIDRALQVMAGLEEAVAVGFTHRLTGEEVGLFVVRNSQTPDENEILKICRAKFPGFKSPKVVVFGNEVPRTPTGKIKRHLLKPLFEPYAEATFSLR